MNWDEDIDLLAGRKSLPKQGRRSNPDTPESEPNSKGFFGDSNPFEMEQPEEKPLIKPRKTSVWGEEGGKSAKSSRSSTNIIELERFQSDHREITSPRSNEDDIPVIPDIDDIQDDPLNLPDVKPMISVDKSTYKELDNQLGVQDGKINFGNLGNIDLSILTNRLYPETEVQIKPEIWTMESLFNDLSRNNN